MLREKSVHVQVLNYTNEYVCISKVHHETIQSIYKSKIKKNNENKGGIEKIHII